MSLLKKIICIGLILNIHCYAANETKAGEIVDVEKQQPLKTVNKGKTGCCLFLENKSNRIMISKATSAGLNAASVLLGSIAFWETTLNKTPTGSKIANACTSGAAGILKCINSLSDEDGNTGKLGIMHMLLNGAIVACNLTSVGLSIASVVTDDLDEKNLYNYISSVTNTSAMFLKGFDLWLSRSPYDNKTA